MRIFIRNRRRQNRMEEGNNVLIQEPKSADNSKPTTEINIADRVLVNGLGAHLNKYVGETVTVFVKGGGASGFGFTGVLMFVNCSYIKLITKPLHNCEYMTLGSIACIPVDKIAAIVHNIV